MIFFKLATKKKYRAYFKTYGLKLKGPLSSAVDTVLKKLCTVKNLLDLRFEKKNYIY